MFHGFGPEGVFDFEDEVTYLTAEEVKIVDAGDSDVIYADTKRSLANAEQAARALLAASCAETQRKGRDAPSRAARRKVNDDAAFIGPESCGFIQPPW